jgi:hypothetical protein
MIVMSLLLMMHWIVSGIEVEMWWKIQIERVVGSPKSQAYFDNASKDEGSKEPMEKPLTQMQLKNRTKKNLNVYEDLLSTIENNLVHAITIWPYYNNLLKTCVLYVNNPFFHLWRENKTMVALDK